MATQRPHQPKPADFPTFANRTKLAETLTDFAPIDNALPARLRLPARDDTGALACSFHGAEAVRGNPDVAAGPLLAVTGPTIETKAVAGRQMKSKAPRSAMLRLSMVLYRNNSSVKPKQASTRREPAGSRGGFH